jgi:4a-hydroxytetrahydrobiopterin dehydratase
MQKLSEQEIFDKLHTITGWHREGESIEKEWQFADFSEAFAFISRVALLAESHNHHPELFNVYNKVKLSFSTHDAGGLTQKDFDIARAVDAITTG